MFHTYRSRLLNVNKVQLNNIYLRKKPENFKVIIVGETSGEDSPPGIGPSITIPEKPLL